MESPRTEAQMQIDAERLADIFTVLQRKFLFNLSKELSRGNVSFPQYFLLAFLGHEKCLTMSEIAQKMEHTTAAATGLIDRLENLGYAKRSHATEDRRKVKVCITPAGAELVERVRKDMVTNLIKMMHRLDPHEQQAWVQIYEKIITYCCHQ
ncbi:MAG: MarR family transcriptional regulator [Verrucomicrobiota bacterium]|nr:MarR family transcriptional regulator [Verrucomicrobiota bacterium]